MTISVSSMAILILTQRRGYLYWANKLQKGKPTNWKRTYFTIDPGTLTQVSYEDGTVRASSPTHLRPGQVRSFTHHLLLLLLIALLLSQPHLSDWLLPCSRFPRSCTHCSLHL